MPQNKHQSPDELGQIPADRKLSIRKFSPALTNQVNLIETDNGRSTADITGNIDNVNLVTETRKVISLHRPSRKELTVHRQVLSYEINPSIRQDKSFEGAVVNFIDVSRKKNFNIIVNGVSEFGKRYYGIEGGT